MKFSVAYYLLLIYSTIMLQPLIPVAIDCWQHTFAEAQHILTIHAKYGSNHLEEELAAASSENGSNKDQNSVKSEETTPVHIAITEDILEHFKPELIKIFSIFSLHKITLVFIAKHIPPPKM